MIKTSAIYLHANGAKAKTRENQRVLPHCFYSAPRPCFGAIFYHSKGHLLPWVIAVAPFEHASGIGIRGKAQVSSMAPKYKSRHVQQEQ